MFRRPNTQWPRLLRFRQPKPPRSLPIRHQSSQASRIDRITARLPRRLQKYTIGLRSAPVSHIVSFMILHELTAIVPLFVLFALFHYTTFVPVAYVSEHFGTYVQSGITRFEKYFSRKGWFGFRPEDVERDQADGVDVLESWDSGDDKYRILAEVALAYAVTKALLPVRIVYSVWATPWFAGVLFKLRTSLTRISKR
ncbi:hypothetical protein E4U09_002768 [Claviceps aff. purpurea]|uniref:Uncharacterized protein n=1 Tax=Claviceps aff. purpurea TaxID=1967640 RepID=A0A9P7QMT8_9HYPO|nr:hypothetical protein E4U09_002768 [Claviceps aff. purpurea]